MISKCLNPVARPRGCLPMRQEEDLAGGRPQARRNPRHSDYSGPFGIPAFPSGSPPLFTIATVLNLLHSHRSSHPSALLSISIRQFCLLFHTGNRCRLTAPHPVLPHSPEPCPPFSSVLHIPAAVWQHRTFYDGRNALYLHGPTCVAVSHMWMWNTGIG